MFVYREAAGDLHRASMMIEDAVEDLISLAVQSLSLSGVPNSNGVGNDNESDKPSAMGN